MRVDEQLAIDLLRLCATDPVTQVAALHAVDLLEARLEQARDALTQAGVAA